MHPYEQLRSVPDDCICAMHRTVSMLCCGVVLSRLTLQVLELASPLAFKVDNVVDKDWVKTVQVFT